ncbi:MAG: hypothetical protein M3Y72_04355 [Acidobacteriota bacterium]|nr:hypothetical protein [Acidobacteriota bacterium]
MLGQTEIKDFHSSSAVFAGNHHDVLGLEVSMNDTLSVRRGKRIRKLKARIGKFFRAEATYGQLAAKCPAGHQLVHDKACVCCLDEIKYDGDPWMA